MMTVISRWSVRSLVQEGVQQLRAAGLTQSRHEVEWLLSHLLRQPMLELYLKETPIREPVVEQFFAILERRAKGQPLQYLLGETAFCGQPVAIKPGVFIPRPETESVVEAVLEQLHARTHQPLRLLDLGTGSGCIAIILAKRLPACFVVGVELSWNALELAKHNLQARDLGEQVALVQGRWLEGIRGAFDVIVSNPPYVPSSRVGMLPLDVRCEPRLSLDGGGDGLRDHRQLLRDAPSVLRPGGLLAMECGEEQVSVLEELARSAAWIAQVSRIDDLAQRPRGVVILRKA